MVNLVIYLFIAIGWIVFWVFLNQKTKNFITNLPALIKHLSILSAYAYSTKCSNLQSLPMIETDTVYWSLGPFISGKTNLQ